MSNIIVSEIEDTSGNLLKFPASVSDGFATLNASKEIVASSEDPAELYHLTLYDNSIDGSISNTDIDWTIPDFVRQANGPMKIVIVGYGCNGQLKLNAKRNGVNESFSFTRAGYSSQYGQNSTSSDGTSNPWIHYQSPQGSTAGYNPNSYHNFMFDCKYIPPSVGGGSKSCQFAARVCGGSRSSSSSTYQESYHNHQFLVGLPSSADIDTLSIRSSGSWFEGFVKVFVFKED
jgi:hypothetical protein